MKNSSLFAGVMVGLFLVTLLITGSLSGCSRSSTGTATSANPAASSEIYFPQEWFYPSTASGSMGGQLVLDDGLLRIQSFPENRGDLVIWPPGFSLKQDISPPEILDDQGHSVARVGDNLVLSGEERYSSVAIMQKTFPGFPDRAEGPYWIMAYGYDLENNQAYQKDYLSFFAGMYSHAHGISFDQSYTYYQLEQIMRDLDTGLNKGERKSYAGLWIQNDPKFNLIVWATKDGLSTVKSYLSQNVTNLVTFRTVRYSLADLDEGLKAAQKGVDGLLKHENAYDYNYYDNRLNYYVSELEYPTVKAAMQKKQIDIPACVNIVADWHYNWLTVQGLAYKLDLDLRSQEAGNYAGSWILRNKEPRVIVLLKDGNIETVKKYVSSEQLADIEVRKAAYSVPELQAQVSDLNNRLEAAGLSKIARAGIYEAQIQIWVNEKGKNDYYQAVSTGQFTQPASAVLVGYKSLF